MYRGDVLIEIFFLFGEINHEIDFLSYNILK